MAPNELIHCDIAKMNFSFSMVSALMNKQLRKYECQKEGNIIITSKIVDHLEAPTSEIEYHSKYYDIYRDGESLIQVQRDESENIFGIVIYSPNGATILMENDNIGRKEYLLSEYAVLYYILRDQDAILIHSSSILYKDRGILFIAKSGTGKSTQARLWKEHLDVIQVNDDKNIIIKENDELWVYGNPWSGKSFIDTYIRVKLTDLVFIYQSPENKIREVSKKEQFLYLIPQITNSSFMYSRDKWDMMTNALMNANGYAMGCTISYDAVEMLKNKLEA